MEILHYLCLSVIFSLHVLLLDASGVYFITAPNLLRYNSAEQVHVNVFNISDLTIQFRLQDYPNRTRSFSESSLTVSEGASSRVTVQVRATDLPESKEEQRYVYLVAESTDPRLPFLNETLILLDGNFGFIFVQTDKPIYTPDQKVKVRVITLDEDRRPTSVPVQIDIKNPQGVIVKRWTDAYRDRFILKTFQLPSIPFYGKNWTVTAKYVDGLTTVNSVLFEVREYVLPRFEVDIDLIGAEIILLSTEWINVTVTARYVYGKSVSGSVTLTFGIIADGNRETCPVSFKKQLMNGEAQFEISIDEIKVGLEDYWFPDGAKLLVEAAVTDDTSGRRELAFDKTAVFSNFQYLVSVEKSQNYFKPALLYRLNIETFWANGKRHPAGNVDVRIEITRYDGVKVTSSVNRLEKTNEDGAFTYLVFMGLENRMLIQVNVVSPRVNDTTEQSSAVLEVVALQSATNNYLSLWPNQAESDLLVDTISTSYRNKSLVYLLMSGGRILDGEVSYDLFRRPINGRYSPNIRMLGFYLTNQRSGAEVVADSTVINIKNNCERELAMSKQKNKIEPGDPEGLTLYINGPPHGLVGFLAVDKAVYLINNKHVLRRNTMFQRFGTHDLGCGHGGGRTAAEVFENAGLTVITNANLVTNPRVSKECSTTERKARSTDALEDELHTHPCCVAGDMFARTVNVSKECYTEGKRVFAETNITSCAKVFFYCCRLYSPSSEDNLGRTNRRGIKDYTFRDVVVDFENTEIRSYFAESWMFEDDDYLDENGNLEKTFSVPDSISTHIIQAVSLSEDYGMCIANPQRIKTFRNFFIDVDFPYSIVRLEQVEVRVSIYNFMDINLPCFVYIKTSKEICAQNTESNYVRVEVNAKGSELVKFPIVPLKAGQFEIEVGVFSINQTNDRVKKDVFVINEGKELTKMVSFWLDPQTHKPQHGKSGDLTVNILHPHMRQESIVDLTLPEKAIPGTGQCRVSAMGNIMDTMVFSLIDNVGTWLDKVPHGCGEQTMILLAPVVYALRYLQATNQLTPKHERRGETLLRLGYQRELTFRKIDGSFAVWQHKPSSTWLTAFVLKVLSEASEFMDIDQNVTCKAMEWLFLNQRYDGAFSEAFPIYHKEIMGGINGQLSLTAYVLIALLESECDGMEDASKNISSAVEYLENHLDILDQSYPLTLLTYALVLGNSSRKSDAINKLKESAVESPMSEEGTHMYRYWSSKDTFENKEPSEIDVEMTSYAVLALLQAGEYIFLHDVVEWLLEQRGSSGEFISTQDTVVGLQALSEYNSHTYNSKIDLYSSLTVSSNTTLEHHITLSDEDIAVQKSVHDIPVNGKLQVTTEGTGIGRMEVEVRYNVNITSDQRCKFSIDVYDSEVKFNFFQNKGFAQDMDCDACGYCTQHYDEDTEEYLEKYHVIDLDPRLGDSSAKESEDETEQESKRAKRSSEVMRMHGASKQQTCLEICVSYTGFEVLDMPVVDVGLPTGYIVEREDLLQLQEKGKVDNFEISKRSVTFYLEKIPDDDEICFKFRVIREFEVENLQAAKIEVYDYYNKEERCIKFYSLRYDIADLDIFCGTKKKENCHCVEGKCVESWDNKVKYGQISKVLLEFYVKICTEFDFAYHIEVSNIAHLGNHYVITTVVKGIIKSGAEKLRLNNEIEFWMNIRCNLLVTVDQRYIVFGKNGIPYTDEQGNNRFRYFLHGDTVVLKDFTRPKYSRKHRYRQWRRNFRRMATYIRRRGC